MLRRVVRSRVSAAALLSVCVALCVGGPAHAQQAAPGAPGAIHVWAPADKHGFGTAVQLASKAWFTLRRGSLSEIYYPDLSTPAFRGLQFAVADGGGFCSARRWTMTRVTSSRSRRACPRAWRRFRARSPSVRSRRAPVGG